MKGIPTRPLGRTGLAVSEICLGTGQFGWSAKMNAADGIFDAYVAAGGNFLDTADIYSQWVEGHTGGESEKLLGAWMKARKNRRTLIVATKCRGRMWKGPAGEGLSRAHIVQACEDSLRRLGTDWIDLYQSHWEDPATPIEETLAAYDDLIRAGKVRYIGSSNFSAGLLTQAVTLARTGRYPAYVSEQPEYSLISRWIEAEHPRLFREFGVGCLPYSPVAQGFLTGKYRKGKPLPKSARISWVTKRFTDKNWAVLAACERIARRRGVKIVQVALAWVLGHDWVTAAIIGASSREQLADNLGAAGLKLTEVEMKDLNEVSK